MTLTKMDKKAEIAQDEKKQQMAEPAPPPYTTHTARDFQRELDQEDIQPQSSLTTTPSRTLAAEYSKWTMTKGRIYDTSTSKILYEAKVNCWNMNIALNHPNADQPFVTVKFHTWSSKIDIMFQDSPPFTIKMGTTWKLNYHFTYNSPALNNELLQWKCSYHLKTTDLECRDAQGVMIARLRSHVWRWKKVCNIELFDDAIAANENGAMDEIVITGLAMLEYVIVNNTVIATA